MGFRHPRRRRPAGSAGAALAAAAALALAAGCGAGQAAEPEPAPEGAWQLASGTVGGSPIETVASHRITLVLGDGRAGGAAACNSYGGRLHIEGDRFELDELAQTEMACEPPVMAAEAAYLDALGRADTIRREGDRLVLEGPSVELRFDPLPPVPTRQLVGVRWELETVIDGDVASTPSVPGATLRLGADGRIEGATGCRTFGGRYAVAGDEVRVTELAVVDAAAAGVCADAAEEQERVMLEVIGDGFRARVDGERLTVTAAGGHGLVFRAP